MLQHLTVGVAGEGLSGHCRLVNPELLHGSLESAPYFKVTEREAQILGDEGVAEVVLVAEA